MTRPTATFACATTMLCTASSAEGPTTSKIANAVRSMMPARSRIARCSALMIGDHQRASRSCSRGITWSPYSSSRGAFDSYHIGRLTEDRRAVRRQREQAVDRVADLRALRAEQVGHQLVGLLELRVEVVG